MTASSGERSVIQGPLWKGRNWAAQAGAGSIHDDATASDLGFRGGTVPGDVHLNQFPATLVEVFGDAWFERGHLSVNFKNATVDLEPVCVFVKPTAPDLAEVWMEREDGLLVCQGTAGLDNLQNAYLHTLDLRPCDPGQLKILHRAIPGTSLGEYPLHVTAQRQFERYDQGLLSNPLPLFRQNSKWGGVVACPSTFIQYLWGPPMDGLRPLVGEAVGLFGAIEIAQLQGPFLLDRDYVIRSAVVSVGQSPKTEYLWYDSVAWDGDRAVASMRMQLRFMKASSEAYA